MIEYNLIRSKRRTIQIQILPNKTVEVRAPKNASIKQIKDFVIEKEKWIQKKLTEKKEILQIPINHFYVPGETFYFRGKQLVLKADNERFIKSKTVLNQADLARESDIPNQPVIPSEIEESHKKNTVVISGNNLIIRTKTNSPAAFQKTFEKWRKEQAMQIFSELLDECWNHFSNYYPKYKKPILAIRTMKTRWGSLSQNKSSQQKMTLNTLLICSRNNCIKHVIYHELCHLIHPNHSKRFYEIFEFFVPDWKKLKEELENLFVSK